MKLLRALVAAGVWLSFVFVVADLAALRWVGEGHWLTTVDLYLPQVFLLAPLVFLAVAALVFGPRRLLVVLVAAALVVLFPIMGLHLGGAKNPLGTPHLRILTYNVDSGHESVDAIVEQVKDAAPDVVVFQESEARVGDAVAAALPGFQTRATTQFFIASRFPIVDLVEPPLIHFEGNDRHARFVEYALDTPLGRLTLFSVHPISPREGFETIRGSGLKHELESGRIFHGDHADLVSNTTLRRLQVEAIAAAAGRAAAPVLIAGDTNLPNGSGIFAAHFGAFEDAFTAAGSGFGYTFPAHKLFAWMRIDRILAGPGLRVTRAEVGTRHGSDHFCLFADVEKAP